ncbi:hypothetical protein N658DRAFT_476277 [Parathielavia hyrcaniae]|uniref:NAD(P)-binding domain-containing protein n=1 Tax=Parathielavia hyrcaniae TaxID=113614 RepID=A0AAN6PZE2_9PEZI|nr:hypothetical protein N658DRAFT_476277 [Parathielavia hyrcaniae]
MSSASTPKRTTLFLGATGGVGFAALRRSLAANHTCIALCRTPSKLASAFSSSSCSESTLPANLHLVEGNAHDADILTRCLRFTPPSDHHDTSSSLLPGAAAANAHTHAVDTVIFSIGALPTLTGMSDPHVCEKGMTALLAAIRRVQVQEEEDNKIRLVAVSSTGISAHVRDVPLLFLPLYKVLLRTPHRDKMAMERLVMGSGGGGGVDGGVEWTIVRGSLYTSGPATEGLVREGMEDPVSGAVEGGTPIGYTISREDVGKWVFENVVEGGKRWVGKAAVITY